MPIDCSVVPNSNSARPICAVHGVKLRELPVPDEMDVKGLLEGFSAYVCPVSRQIVLVPKK
jgi:hypothetical protein